MGQRLEQLQQWAGEMVGGEPFVVEPASADASFRRYFRLHLSREGAGESMIVMDAPPDKEDSRPFVSIARVLRACGVNAPEIHAVDLERGFMLLSDLGVTSYLDRLDGESADSLYRDAMETLLALQQRWPREAQLPPYDRELLMREMELFPQWYLGVHRGERPTSEVRQRLEQQFLLLASAALEQPQVAVHRDYHSRNLMVVEGEQPGVIDFQDAVRGAITYDLVSLLRDCYIDWPQSRVEGWAHAYYQRLVESRLVEGVEWPQFLRWFDWMGVQRHLKAIGIFARLNHRDGKPGYLGDIPRTMNYIVEVSGRYPELAPLHQLTSRLQGGEA